MFFPWASDSQEVKRSKKTFCALRRPMGRPAWLAGRPWGCSACSLGVLWALCLPSGPSCLLSGRPFAVSGPLWGASGRV